MKKPIQFGKYFLLDRINVGGMAEVFKAKAFGVEGFERLLAVKRILPNIAEDEEFITMFIDEAKIAVQLNHANICQIFDLGKVEDSYFIALEFVHGKDVRAIFDRCKQKPVDGSTAMPIAQASFIVMKACEGLDYAHNKRDPQGREVQLVHRDVSPQNVLISYEGEVKLIDFGIAKAAGKMSKTQQGILKGKFGYMSPEQVRGLPLDRRSDIFSLGIVLYELLTGERLFIGESDFSTLEKVRNVEILPPSTYNRRISDELERIVMKALAKDVEDRYQNAIDLHDDLQAFMYTAGEFYSRKDLASWMKKVFAQEIEAESAKLESYRSMPVPEAARPTAAAGGQPHVEGGRSRRNSIPPPPPSAAHAVAPPPVPMSARPSQQHQVVPPAPPGKPANGHAHKRGPEAELGWDEEELATNIYDSPPDASDAVVDDKPDLSKVELSADGAAVPSAPINLHNKGGAPRNGTASRPAVGRPVDFAVPEPAPTQHPSGPAAGFDPNQWGARQRPPAKSRIGLYVGVGALGALVCAAAVWLFLFLGNKPGEVVITSDPAVNVQVLVDNKRVPVDGTPATLKLEPGSYVLTVQREGFVPWNEQVEVKAGDTLRKRIVLEPLASGTGFTLVSDPPGAQAFLDGNTLEGVTPLKVQSVPPGKHTIEVRGPSHTTWTQEVNLEPGKTIDVRAELKPKQAVAALSALAPGRGVSPKPERVAAEKTPAPPKAVDKPVRDREAAAVTPVAVKTPAPTPVEPKPAPKELGPSGAAGGAERSGTREPRPVKAATTKEAPLPRPPAQEKTPEPKPVKARPVLVDEETEKPAPKAKAAVERPASGGGEGYLRLGSKPWTNITVDGKDSGLHTPQTQMKLPAGTHRITLTNPQFNIKETFSVDVKAGETSTVIKDLRQQGADTD